MQRTKVRRLVMVSMATWLVASLAALAGTEEKKLDQKQSPKMTRYMVVRTFPAGALDGLDAQVKQSVNQKNEANGARWIHSYANADKTKTFCVYEGRDEAAVRKAAEANGLPVDQIIEIPVDLTPR